MKIPFKTDHFALKDAERWAEELETLLQQSGLSVAPGSELERICLAPSEILSYRSGEGIASATVYRQYVDAAALAEMATRLLAARYNPSFEGLIPHLALLNVGDPRQAGRARATDQAARKLFELFTALLAMRFSDFVEIEHPVHGAEGNPNVVVEYEGKRWGLACKVPTSASRESLVQNLQRAAEQVVASGVDAGFPMFNLKNVIPPESYWRTDPEDPTERGFLVLAQPTQLLTKALNDVADLWRGIEEYVGSEVFAKLLSPRPCVPAILSYFHVIAPVRHDSFIGATTSRFVACYHLRTHSNEDEVLVHALHASAIAEWA